MTADDFLPYCHSLAPLESLLTGVKRPGDFWAHGALRLPMPMVQVDVTAAVARQPQAVEG